MGDYVTEAIPTTRSDAQEVLSTMTTAKTKTSKGGDALTLHGYQKLAVEFLRNRGRAALLLQMGL